MNIFHAMILGAVQGLTEFLPVSSSGHLVLLQNFFGISNNALFFAVMLHLGTLLAVFIVYWRQIWELITHPFSPKVWLIVLATIPAAVIGYKFNSFFEGAYGGSYLGLGFIATALILTLAERFQPGKKKNPTVLDAIVIGILQAVAIFPGVSRSGSTIAGGLGCGLDRKSAADFSFLMSIPIILGSVVVEGKDVIEAGLSTVNWPAVIVGVVFAAVSGFIAIKLMLRLLTKSRLYGFSLYVLALGVFVLLDQYIFHMFFFTKPF